MRQKRVNLELIAEKKASITLFTSTIVAVVVFMMATTVAMASSTAAKYIILPKLKDSNLDRMPERTKIFAADGTLLSTLYHENRERTSIDEVPDNMIRATVAIEDQRFFEHKGVDGRSMVRALIANLKQGGIVEGG